MSTPTVTDITLGRPAEPATPRADVAAIRAALALLVEPGAVTELRIPKAGRAGTVSGYYNDLDKLAREAAEANRRYGTTYHMLNPVKLALLARRANRYDERVDTTTGDIDIERRRWLLVDLDPRRPAGISSTDAEHAAALELARVVRDTLTAPGWPVPIYADSGNGAHLLYRIELPNDDASRELVKGVLDGLAFRFGDETVDVDRTTFNAARISKLYGTEAMKGDSTPDRPHRLARVLDAPAELVPVAVEELRAVAAWCPPTPKRALGSTNGASFDVSTWIAEHGLDVSHTGTWSTGTKWILNPCPWNPDHTNGAAFIVQFATGAIAAGCHHNGCAGKDWHELRALYEAPVPGHDGGFSTNGAHPPGDAEPWLARQRLPSAPPVPTLPPELVPAALRAWLTDAAARACLPLECFAAPAIVAFGGFVGRAVGIRPWRFDDFTVIPNVWGALVARPGQLKSYAIGEAFSPLVRLEATARERFKQAEAAAEATRDRVRAEIDALKETMKASAKKRQPLDELENRLASKKAELNGLMPVQRRYVTNDATPEKLQELLRDNPRGLTAKRDELSAIFAAFDRQGREGEREFFLEAWNGDGSFTVDRIGRGTIYLPAVTLALFGGIQPGKLAATIRGATAGGAGDDGLIQRLQVLVWPDGLPEWKQADTWPDRDARNRAFGVFEWLDDLDPSSVGAAVDDAGGIPYLRFDPEAQQLADVWREELERRLRSADLAGSPAFEAHIGKYRSLFPSLALLFHLVAVAAGAPAGLVPLNATRLAAAWCDFLEAHARKVYAEELEPGHAAAHALAERIEAGEISDGQPVRDIYRNQWTALDTSERVAGALTLLAGAGWLRLEDVATGGRASRIVRLHPDLREADSHA